MCIYKCREPLISQINTIFASQISFGCQNLNREFHSKTMSKRLISRHTSVIIILAICERSADDQLVVTKDKEVINDTDEQRAGSSYHTHIHSCMNTRNLTNL